MNRLRSRIIVVATAACSLGAAAPVPLHVDECTTIACTSQQIYLARQLLRATCGDRAGTFWFTCDPNGLGIWEDHYTCS